jgi:transcriptional regulator with XRE-family HTH domain
MSNKTNLAKKVESLRKKQGLSQKKLAHLADVSNNTIINIEERMNVNPTIETIETLHRIAKALDVSVKNLIK